MSRRDAILIGVFVSALIFFIVASAPLGVFMRASGLMASGLSFARADGTIWRGALTEASWRGRPLGDIALEMRPASLLLGRADLDFEFDGDGVYGRGGLSVTLLGRVVLRDAAIRAELDRFEFNEPAPLAIAGSFAADIGHLIFSRRGCEAAEGEAWTDVLAASARALDYQGPALTARARCDDGKIILPFVGRDENEEIALTLTFDRNYAYRLYTEVRTNDARLGAVLPAFGFQGGGGVFEYERRGRVALGPPVS